MLQRVQTIYLALAFICVSLMLMFPIFIISVGDKIQVKFTAYGYEGIAEGITNSFKPIYILIIFLALLTLLGILLYKNRPKQILVVRLAFIIHIIAVIGFTVYSYLKESYFKMIYSEIEQNDFHFGYGISYFLLFVSIPFLLLAIRGIKADEKLVKSLDRLR